MTVFNYAAVKAAFDGQTLHLLLARIGSKSEIGGGERRG
jgi:hypothetical protein